MKTDRMRQNEIHGKVAAKRKIKDEMNAVAEIRIGFTANIQMETQQYSN